MTKIGTLMELDVKPGDVVECVNADCHFSWTEGVKYDVLDYGGTLYCNGVSNGIYDGGCTAKFRIISRASDIPKLWRDMTPEEKGALLLAHHEGKVIEYLRFDGVWTESTIFALDSGTYRIRPEPKIETVSIEPWEIATDVAAGHRITFNTIDGKPDCASIKMEAI